RGGVDHGIGPTTGFRGDERILVLSLVTCMIALSPASVFRLAMVLPFMHLQPCGGPRGRRKRFRRRGAQWLGHRAPNTGGGGSRPSTPARRSPARSAKSRQRNGLWAAPRDGGK